MYIMECVCICIYWNDLWAAVQQRLAVNKKPRIQTLLSRMRLGISVGPLHMMESNAHSVKKWRC